MVKAQTNCVHQHSLNTKVHKFIFQVSDEKSVDQFFEYLDESFQDHSEGDVFLMMTDLRPDGIPPFNYTLSAARSFFNHRNTTPELRAVYIYDKNALLTIIRTFFGLLPLKSQRKFFQGSTNSGVEQEALAWLLSDEA